MERDQQVHAVVTAVIVTYNSSTTIDGALQSLVPARDAGLLECVVVDNASSDGTLERVRERHPWVRALASGGNLGFGRGCNLGFAAVRTPLVLFLNPDAELDLEALTTLLSFMEEHPECAACAPALVYPNGTEQLAGMTLTPWSLVSRAWTGQLPPRARYLRPGEAPLPTDWICGAIFLMRSSLFRAVAGMDPRFFLYFEETDLWRRVRMRGWQLYTVGTAVGRHVGGASAERSNKPVAKGLVLQHYHQSRRYYLCKHHGRFAAFASELVTDAIAIARHCFNVLRGTRREALRMRFAGGLLTLPAPVADERPGPASEELEGAHVDKLASEPPSYASLPRLRRRVSEALRRCLRRSYRGRVVIGSATHLRGPMPLVLMYHSITDAANRPFIDPSFALPAEQFRRHLEFLTHHHEMIGVNELREWLAGERELSPRAAVISFDDGYLDTLRLAAPILREFGVPGLLFLCTGYVTRQQNQWIDQLYCTMRYRCGDDFELPGFGHGFSLRTGRDRRRAYAELRKSLLLATWSEREELLVSLAEQLRPSTAFPRLTLGWDDVRVLRQQYPELQLALHTRDHVSLTDVHLEDVDRELLACVADAQRELDERLTCISYPYGRVNAEVEARVRELGFELAFASCPAELDRSACRSLRLPRLDAPTDLTPMRAISRTFGGRAQR